MYRATAYVVYSFKIIQHADVNRIRKLIIIISISILVSVGYFGLIFAKY